MGGRGSLREGGGGPGYGKVDTYQPTTNWDGTTTCLWGVSSTTSYFSYGKKWKTVYHNPIIVLCHPPLSSVSKITSSRESKIEHRRGRRRYIGKRVSPGGMLGDNIIELLPPPLDLILYLDSLPRSIFYFYSRFKVLCYEIGGGWGVWFL